MPFKATGLPGLKIFEPRIFEDDRGYFFESFNKKVFDEEGVNSDFVQDNQSRSSYGVIRGLHYQKEPHAQAKQVRVLEGKVLDVVVDLRKNSPTFGKTYALELSSDNKLQLYIPKGFAHGYSVLSEWATFFYKCDNLYNKPSEGGIIYNDPGLNIDWKVSLENAIFSEKDLQLPKLENADHNFLFKD